MACSADTDGDGNCGRQTCARCYPQNQPLPDEGWKDRLVDLIMARKHGASGMAVFVDPVIVRGLIEDALAGKTARVDKRVEQPR